MIEWSWHSILISSLSACVSNLGNFLEFCNWSSLSAERFKFIGGFICVADVCRVVRRSTIGDEWFNGWSRFPDDSSNESSELSDKAVCGFDKR
jgi:hypothetical protein